MSEIKVSIVEDNETVRQGLEVLLNGSEGTKCIASYESCEDLLNEITVKVTQGPPRKVG